MNDSFARKENTSTRSVKEYSTGKLSASSKNCVASKSNGEEIAIKSVGDKRPFCDTKNVPAAGVDGVVNSICKWKCGLDKNTIA